MKWQYNYTLNDDQIDKQHEKLISEIERLRLLVDEGCANDLLVETFIVVINYAKDHFVDEERLMHKIGFPEMENQEKMHAGFIEKIDDQLLKFRSHKKFEIKELFTFLQLWIENHILVEDRKIADFIAQKGKDG